VIGGEGGGTLEVRLDFGKVDFMGRGIKHLRKIDCNGGRLQKIKLQRYILQGVEDISGNRIFGIIFQGNRLPAD
jgi:hypothetical protein